jgi:uncharacterized membrane protein YedE/YeeE
MTVSWELFTPWTAIAGGVLIGLSATVFILFNGRIAGISGILGGLMRASSGERTWRIAFLAGLLMAPLLWQVFAALPPVTVTANTWQLIGAGLLVGYGTQLGSGCTSGHGVCGISRGSIRSLVATGLFMFAGFVTVYVTRHLLGGAV